MSKSNRKRLRNHLSWPVVWLAALLLIGLSVGSHLAASATGSAGAPPDLKAQAKATALRAATKTATMGFAPSLEMKENADFLLTPALLVQEAMSDEWVVTYPSE